MKKKGVFPLMIMAGLFDDIHTRKASKIDIGTQPIAPKHEERLISKQKINKMKGKKARKNRGRLR